MHRRRLAELYPGATPRLQARDAMTPLSSAQRRARTSVAGKLANGRYKLVAVNECICGSTDGRGLASRDRYGLPVGVVLCLGCGLARTTPRLAAESIRDFYELEYHQLHFGIADPEAHTALFRRGQGRLVLQFVGEFLPDGLLRVADVGAGTGQVLREVAAAADGRVAGIGCDYNPAFVGAGLRAGTDMRVGGPEVLSGAAPFDLVILSHVVEHFPDPVADLAAVRALGHDKTLFYVEVPGLLTIQSKSEYAFSFEQYFTLAHTYHFTAATLAATLARAGFAPLRMDEEVRSVFVHGQVAEPAPDPSVAAAIRESLGELDSWGMRVRRLRPRARQMVAAGAKSILPDWAVTTIRRRR